MKREMVLTIGAMMLLGEIAVPGLTLAQIAQESKGSASTGRPGYEQSQELNRYKKMAEIMHEMTQEMSRMREQMAKGDMTADTHKQMSQRMKQMSRMMRRMSGLLDRPAMKGKDDLEMNRQMEEMRKQMDAMKADAPIAPAKK
jgi:hypothetical protein